MTMKINDLIQLPQLKDLRIAGGAAGLDRTLQWVHVVELPDIVHWSLSGKLLFMTGIGIRDNPNLLTQIVEECSRRSVAGLVLNTGSCIPFIPPETVQMSNHLNFPLFKLPGEVNLGEVTKEICNHILSHQVEEKSIQDIIENILYGDCSNPDELCNQASLYNYDLSKPHRVMILQYQHTLPSSLANLDTEQKVMEEKSTLQNLVREAFNRVGKKVLTAHRSERVVLLVPSDGNMQEVKSLQNTALNILDSAQDQLKNIRIYIGWGNRFDALRDGKRSMEQADLALKVAMASGKKRCFGYEGLGFYKVLFNVSTRNELESFRSEILSPLNGYDQHHKGELLSTLSAFLEDTENLALVADKLRIHRNTLRYRIQKIEELTGLRLNDTQDRMHLYFATVVDKYLSL